MVKHHNPHKRPPKDRQVQSSPQPLSLLLLPLLLLLFLLPLLLLITVTTKTDAVLIAGLKPLHEPDNKNVKC